MPTPLPPCCQRRQTSIARAEYDLQNVARRCARRPSEKLKAMVLVAKEARDEARRARDDHDAEHAGA